MEHLRIEELVEFSTEKRTKKKLFGSRKIVAGLLCFEPGQAAPIHHHPMQDEVFYVLEGSGTISIGDERATEAPLEETTIQPKSLIFVPAKARFGITAANHNRLVLLFFKSPALAGDALA
jgi:mannose-6-phosphate isomerase-like protein (cupin superfamily)